MFIAGLVALIAAQALKKSFDASDVVLIVLSVAIGVGRGRALRARRAGALVPAACSRRRRSCSWRCSCSRDPISKLAFPDEAQARTIGGVSQAPIVVVLLDELPSNTLVDEHGRIDAERYPGFAELARNATWFQNAYTVYDSTERAQPAIMDGNLPAKDKLPTSADHPNSIFSLFGKTHRHERLRGGDLGLLARPLRGRAPRRGLRQPDGSMSEDLGLVWLHVVSPPDIEADLTVGVRELGQLRRRAEEGAGPRQHGRRAQHARQPERRAARRASRSGSTTSSRAAGRR